MLFDSVECEMDGVDGGFSVVDIFVLELDDVIVFDGIESKNGKWLVV